MLNDYRYGFTTSHAEEWQVLVQVCQRWQQIIYGSPRYLDLHLHCSNAAPFRNNHSRWPEFPLTLKYVLYPDEDDLEDFDDLVAALEQSDRVHLIHFMTRSSKEGLDSRVDRVLEKMKVPFPALTYLNLIGTVLPHGFLGGSAPCLQRLYLENVSPILFQELPKLLLSARNLTSLRLEDIPKCPGYISLEAMVGGLAGLTKLRTLSINFRFPREIPDSNEVLGHRRRPEPSMRAVLPALTKFVFNGESAYLEDIVAQIDMPSVEDIKIEYFPPTVEVHELSQFICRTKNLDLTQFKHAQVDFDIGTLIGTAYSHIKLDQPQGQGEHREFRFSLGVKISISALDDLVACMTRVLGQLTVLLSNVRNLSLKEEYGWQDWYAECFHLDDSKLLPLLHLFPAVEALHVYGLLVYHIRTALENIDEERVSEVMPALRSLQFDNGYWPLAYCGRFLSLRQLSGHPVAAVRI